MVGVNSAAHSHNHHKINSLKKEQSFNKTIEKEIKESPQTSASFAHFSVILSRLRQGELLPVEIEVSFRSNTPFLITGSRLLISFRSSSTSGWVTSFSAGDEFAASTTAVPLFIQKKKRKKREELTEILAES